MAKTKNPGSVLQVEKIRISGLDWDLKPDNDDTRHGCCSTPDKHYIKINGKEWNDVNGTYLDTILHECIHAICNMKLLPKHHLKEFQVSQVAEGLHELLLDNPKFVKWLSEYAAWQRQHIKK